MFSCKFVLVALALYLSYIQVIQAEITIDNTISNAALVTKIGSTYNINANPEQLYGSNLFHSFSQFNLESNETAAFNPPDLPSIEINNVISRITGGQESTINGTIQSNIESADFYFINPFGIVFGEGAKLDIDGAFYASTAQYLALGIDKFSANIADKPILTSAEPSAFGFIDQTPTTITLNGSSIEASSLALVGGDITINGSDLLAPAGKLSLISLNNLPENGLEIERNFSNDLSISYEHLGKVSISKSQIDVTDKQTDDGIPLNKGIGGQLFIRASELLLDNNASVTANNISDEYIENFENRNTISIASKNIELKNRSTIEASGGGEIEIIGEKIILSDFSSISATSTSILSSEQSSTFEHIVSKTGRIYIKADQLNLFLASLISASQYNPDSQESAGSIEIVVDNVVLDFSFISAGQSGKGSAGNIVLRVKTLDMNNFSSISGIGLFANPELSGGADIKIHASELVKLDASAINTGTPIENSGSVSITGGANVSIINTSTIKTEAQSGGGNIIIGTEESPIGRIYIENAELSTKAEGGTAGNIDIFTLHDLILKDSSLLAASSKSAGGNITITANGKIELLRNTGTNSENSAVENESNTVIDKIDASAEGKGGNITISSPANIILKNLNLSARSNSSEGGNISIITNGRVEFLENSINASAEREGGNISISTPTDTKLENSTLSASSDSLEGGNISIITNGRVEFLENSKATAQGETGGGNINILQAQSSPDTLILLLSDDIQINASTKTGKGGDINIRLDGYVAHAGATVDASSEKGISGQINIDNLNENIEEEMLLTETTFITDKEEVQDLCEVHTADFRSTFEENGGRGGVYHSPDDVIPPAFCE